MADIPADYRDQLDLRAVIEDIDRTRAETQKFNAEQRKPIAEAAKLERDRWLAPWVLLVSISAGLVAAIGTAIVTHLWK